LHRLARGRDMASPYWAYHWGGGLALARHVLDHPETVRGKRVVDLGTGSGLVAIAAAKAGAASVLAVDIDPHAVVAAGLNATANGVAIEVLQADLLDGEPPDTDVLLIGDLFYDAALAERVTTFLDRCLSAGMAILVGDPWRAPLPRHRLRPLADYAVAETGTTAKPAAAFAFLNGYSD
jgi:predicted nicotinamide N-methyase